MTSLPPAPAGLFDGAVHLFTVRAYFLRWFERARSDMVRLLGMDQRAANEGGEGAWAVSELEIRYRAPARLDDAVLIETRCEELGAASARMHQRALKLVDGQPGQLLSEARLRIGFVGPDGRPRRQPAQWRTAFQTLLDQTGTQE